MNLKLQLLVATATVAAFVLAPSPLAAQAFTPPQGFGSITVGWQFVDNTGHRFSDGFLAAQGQSVTTSALVEVDYGVTDRFSATFGLPYVFAKYTGALPSFSRLPIDECKCWQSSFQDLSVAARYRLGGDSWAVTPTLKYGRPTHNYPYQGEAVVGRNLQEVQLGVNAGVRLAGILPKASVGAGYSYSFVERPLDTVRIDRSNGYFEFGYAVLGPLYVRGIGIFQRTHGGLRVGSVTRNPFPFPGELNTPERFAQRDRLLRTHYWQAGGGVSYSAGPVDLFLSITKYVWGRDAHNGQAYTAGATWYFDLLQ